MKKKTMALVLALTMVIGCAIGGTIAYLQANSGMVRNTFTVGDINISIAETGATKAEGSADFAKNFKMVPGTTLDKDPTVTVKAGSQACYLFIKVTESDNLKDYISYNVLTGKGNWTLLAKDKDNNDLTGVYYRIIESKTTADAAFSILENDQVTVNDSVTEAMMNALQEEDATQPTLSFKAAAIQLNSANNTRFTDVEAYDNLPDAFKN